jgi:hypothetical protein
MQQGVVSTCEFADETGLTGLTGPGPKCSIKGKVIGGQLETWGDDDKMPQK